MATRKQKRDVNIKYDSAPLTRRFISYIVDWYVGALCTAIPISLIAQKVEGSMLNQNLLRFSDGLGMMAGLLALGCALFYFLIVPTYIWKGQTPGKRMMKIKVVKTSGDDVSIKNMFLRQVLGMIIIEGVLVSASAIWHQVFTLASGISIVKPLMYAGFVITGLSILLMLFKGEQRALHDYIGQTKVIDIR